MPQFDAATPIAAYLRASYPASGAWTLIQIYRNRNDVVFKARGEDGLQLAVKHNANPAKNRNEYNALRALNAVTKESVSALALSPESAFFTMEWIDAPLLLARMQGTDRLQKIALAGQWLRRFHRATIRDVRFSDPFLLPDMSEEWRYLAPDWHRVEARLYHMYIPSPRRVQLHTDFQLHNLFDMGGHILANDPAQHRLGHPYFDVTRFLIGLGLHRRLANINQTPWPDTERMDRWAFLIAYHGVPEPDWPFFEYIEALQIARQRNNFMTRYPDTPARNQRVSIFTEMLTARADFLHETRRERPLHVA